MNPTTKKILWIAGGALVVSSIVGFQKVTKIKEIFDEMDIDPDRIDKVNISFDRIKFNLDIRLRNNSMEDLFVTGASIVTLKQIIIFHKNTYLATVNLNIGEIEIPRKSDFFLRNIPVTVDTVNTMQNIRELADFNLNNIAITGIINAMGNDYEIGTE
ncbi:hypothetical protein ACI6PS_03645 [Flavobacterium sp. PLA-1-15]|uniref:hypothetical protein n=1 Tax=Flavobacterium sp. PLA-1-15 TaxID=3380533 RepID=UPI003B77252F